MSIEPVQNTPSLRPLRPAWIEVNLAQLRRNFTLINLDKPNPLALLSVVKDNAYGHGAVPVGRVPDDPAAEDQGVGHLFDRPADAEALKTAQLRNLEISVGDISFLIQEDFDFTVTFQPGDRIDGDSFHFITFRFNKEAARVYL
jgi:hypothetical protein